MAVRFKNGRDCPTPAHTAIAKAAVQAATQVLTSPAESERLWKHVLFGAGTVAGMIHGYAKLGLPGEPREGIQAIIATLTDALAVLDDQEQEGADDEDSASGGQ